MLCLGGYRRALVEARLASRQMLMLHRDILVKQRRANRDQLGIARRALEKERQRTARARHECDQIYAQAKEQAQEYRVIWLQAKKDGAHLLEFVDRRLKRAA